MIFHILTYLLLILVIIFSTGISLYLLTVLKILQNAIVKIRLRQLYYRFFIIKHLFNIL